MTKELKEIMTALTSRLLPFALENEKAVRSATHIEIGQVVLLKDIHKNNPCYDALPQPEKGDYGKAFKPCAEALGYKQQENQIACTNAYIKFAEYSKFEHDVALNHLLKL